MIKYLALLMIFPALAACNNAYDLFYDEVPHSSQLAPVTDDPRLMTGGNPRQVALAMYREGYALIGVSEFVGPAVPPAVALRQAKKVGAAIVVVTGKYQSAASRPINTSANSGIDSVAAGNLVFGTESEMVTSNGKYRYAQVGLFFAPLQRRGLGILYDKLSDEQTRRAGTEGGVQIVAVRTDSPGYLADIEPGDLLVSVEGKGVFDKQSTSEAITQASGHSAEFVLVRSGIRIVKSAMIPQGTW